MMVAVSKSRVVRAMLVPSLAAARCSLAAPLKHLKQPSHFLFKHPAPVRPWIDHLKHQFSHAACRARLSSFSFLFDVSKRPSPRLSRPSFTPLSFPFGSLVAPPRIFPTCVQDP
ncbi:hypothetical protein K432DRAFT_163847 [Lepidopterella palustris CBS 459.81]|uniref:Uncharacterized protein n=1 Tax=Lepidopterella palustris CBS 459.81 TaxID=1314670 RepID=A0A8E2EH89_9PEZI|nr:hypothetical protein K432DRAFT_163847 [Lepidopterella palustris CBS 459.81]